MNDSNSVYEIAIIFAMSSSFIIQSNTTCRWFYS